MSTLTRFSDVRYGQFENLDIGIDSTDNSIYVSVPSIERMLGYESNTGRKKLSSKGFLVSSQKTLEEVKIQTKTFTTTDVKGNQNYAQFISFSLFWHLICWEASSLNDSKTKEICCHILHECAPTIANTEQMDWQYEMMSAICDAITETRPKTKQTKNKKQKNYKGEESQIQKTLLNNIGGEPEVCTPSGRIDILTSTELIEIKSVKSWKSAVGQLLVYGHYYPSHQLRLHLFGSMHSSMENMIRDHCNKFNIILTTE